MIALVEGAERQKTPNEIALNILLAVLTLVFLLVVVTLQPFAYYAGTEIPIPVLIALLVCLIPTTIGALISAIGIAGMDRLVQHNVLAMSGRAVEAAGDVDTLLLDKTGHDHAGQPSGGGVPAGARRHRTGAGRCRAARRRSPTRRPKGARSSCWRSKVRHSRARPGRRTTRAACAFSAQTRMSGIDPRRPRDPQGRARRHRAIRAASGAGRCPAGGAGAGRTDRTRSGGTPLVVAENGRRARRRASEGHRQGRHARSLRAHAGDGHQDGDDHRRQPADGRGDRGGGGRRRLHGAGDARGQAGADSSGAGQRPDGGDDRRRHERRARRWLRPTSAWR